MMVSDFINLFKTGRLGKKRQHTSYRVMDGEHCQLLVRSVKKDGIPGGSELIGIYFGDGICIFHSNFNDLRGSVINQVSDPKPVFNSYILKGDEPALIDSGIIGFDDEKKLLLMEIGDTPWLLEYDPLFKPSSNTNWPWTYNTGTQVSRRVETVAEAEKDIVLADDEISNLGYLLRVMSSDFVPIATSEEDEKLLMNPPKPIDYGLTFDDLTIPTVYTYGSKGCKPLFVKDSALSSPRGIQFKADAEAYNLAVDRLKNRKPSNWETLAKKDTGTILVGVNEQVYLKGCVSLKGWGVKEEANFKVWHRVLGKTPKLRLLVR